MGVIANSSHWTLIVDSYLALQTCFLTRILEGVRLTRFLKSKQVTSGHTDFQNYATFGLVSTHGFRPFSGSDLTAKPQSQHCTIAMFNKASLSNFDSTQYAVGNL